MSGDPHAGVMQLRLRLLHSGGHPRHGVLHVAARGTGLAAALELCGERLNAAQLRAADRCRIARQADAGWQICDDSRALVCSLNDVLLAFGEPHALTAGDLLEVSLHRFIVEIDADTATAVESPPAAAMEAAPAAVPEHEPEPAEVQVFDLRELALLADASAPAALSQALPEPFEMLCFAAGPRQPVLDPLAGLLDTEPPHGIHGGPGTPEAAATSQAEPSTPQRADDPPPTEEEALLEELHAEFVRVVQDPAQLAGRAADAGSSLPVAGADAPTLEQLAKDAEHFALLRDILLPRAPIQHVIDDFDVLGESDLVKVQEPEEVLRLFAPELARSVRPPVPSLTRREHHQLSPDSPMPMTPARPADEAPSQ